MQMHVRLTACSHCQWPRPRPRTRPIPIICRKYTLVQWSRQWPRPDVIATCLLRKIGALLGREIGYSTQWHRSLSRPLSQSLFNVYTFTQSHTTHFLSFSVSVSATVSVSKPLQYNEYHGAKYASGRSFLNKFLTLLSMICDFGVRKSYGYSVNK